MAAPTISLALGTTTNSPVFAIAEQTDGKVVIGGDFTEVVLAVRGRFAHLDSDGTLDAGFGSNSRTNNPVLALAIQLDGKVLIAEEFTQFVPLASTHNRIARINTSGSLDTNFSTGSGANAIHCHRISSAAKRENTDRWRVYSSSGR